MPNKLEKRDAKDEAMRLDAEIATEFERYRGAGAELWRKIQAFVDAKVYEALDLTLSDWLDTRFGYSASYVFRKLRQRRLLADVPSDKVEAMPDSNAEALSSLPGPLRSDPAMVEHAIREKPAKFKERAKKAHPKADIWKTYAVRLPIAVYRATEKSDEKIARVLRVDISEGLYERNLKRWTANRVLVAEAKARLINDTDESHLLVEIEGET